MSIYFMNVTLTPGKASVVEFPQPITKAYAALAGFDATYGSGTDHFILELAAGVTANAPQNSSVTVTGSLTMKDNSGHSGSGTVYAMVIGQSEDDTTQFTSQTYSNGGGQVSATFPSLAAPTAQAYALITSFDLQYSGDDHRVQEIVVESGNNTVSVRNTQLQGGTWSSTVDFLPALVMQDDSGNKASSSSNLGLLVMAIP